MVRGCVIKRIKDLNHLPSKNVIANELSPKTLITGRANPDFRQAMKLNFGDYVQAYNGKKIINTNKSRLVGAISLYPPGNEVGRLIVMSLVTGKEIHRNGWDELLVEEEVLNRIYETAFEEGQKSINENFVYEMNDG